MSTTVYKFLIIDHQLRVVECPAAEVVKVANGRVMRWIGIDVDVTATAWAGGANAGEYFRFPECIIIKIKD